MCLSSAPARFNDTLLYAGVAPSGAHVIGYQNTATNLAVGANCMMLPMQSLDPMGPANILDTRSCKNILRDMRTALMPVSKGLTRGGGSFALDSMSVQVFDHDIYTIALGLVGADFGRALASVSPDRRPSISREILDFWARHYRGYHLALCCFNNRDAQQAAPMLWCYNPAVPETLVAPAVDGHDGHAPRPGAPVDLDHFLMASCPDISQAAEISYTDRIPAPLRAVLPTRAVGQSYEGYEGPNGDFLIDTGRLRSGRLDHAVTRGILSIAA